MINRLVCLCGILLCSVSAQAQTHLEMNVTLSSGLDTLRVSGTASTAVQIPGKSGLYEKFSYEIAMPAQSPAENWRGGAFRNEDYLYLPGGWHPSADGLLTYDIRLESPPPAIPVLAGEIMDESLTETNATLRVQMARPVEAIALFAGPYAVESITSGPVEVRTYFPAGLKDLSPVYLERTEKYLERFSKDIGAFPFKSFHIVSSPLPVGLGFAGMTYVGQAVLALPFIPETSLGHEILHNYFGNGIFPDYQSGNWAEGLTTYMADYMTAEAASADKARDMRLSWLRDYNALPQDREQPVTAFRAKHSQASQVLGYNKVAFIFHMLRRELGDRVFTQAIQTLWRDYAFKTASWSDLENVFGDVAQKDLSVFFKQWVHGTGAPEISGLTAQVINMQSGHDWKARVRVVQAPPYFNAPLPLTISAGGRFFETHVRLDKLVSTDTIHLPAKPNALSIDPDFHLFRHLGHDEVPAILRDVMLANTPVVIMDQTVLDHQEDALLLSKRLLEHDFEVVPLKTSHPETPFVLFAYKNKALEMIKRWHLPVPNHVQDDEKASVVWAARLQNAVPYMVIALANPDDLKGLRRALPHYGRQASLVYSEGRVTYKSVGQTNPVSLTIH